MEKPEAVGIDPCARSFLDTPVDRSFYSALLGVSEQAGPAEIKGAYRRLVRRHHPDLFPPETRDLQQWRMIQINEAYQGLLAGDGMPRQPLASADTVPEYSGEFHRAHGYFGRVLDDFPDSIWKADAEYKLRRIEGFNRVYHRIRRNLATRNPSGTVAEDVATAEGE